jgi:hypothetical protein
MVFTKGLYSGDVIPTGVIEAIFSQFGVRRKSNENFLNLED